MVIRTDARRRPLGHIDKPSTDGHTVVLTLDESIQHVAERELERAVAETGSVAGVAIVMDPHTGEILALANRPTFNPNRFQAYPSARWRNRAVSDSFEPGSIFKIFTAAAAPAGAGGGPRRGDRLRPGVRGDRGVPHQRPQRLRPAPLPRGAWRSRATWGWCAWPSASGRENFNRYMRGFGFGATTGVDLPGETGGLLRPDPALERALAWPRFRSGRRSG